MAGTPKVGIVITGDSSQLIAAASAAQQKIGSLGDAATRFGALMPALGVSIAAAFAAVHFRGAVDMMDKLDEMAEKTGISVEALSKLRYAGETVGTSTEQLGSGFKKLAKLMADAAGGADEAANIFKTVGVTFKDATGQLLPTEKVLADLADKFSGWEDGPAKAALAMKVFGKSGEDMIPFLNLGAAGLAASADEAKRLGIELGSGAAKAAADFNDSMKKMDLLSDSVSQRFVNQLLPGLNKMAQDFLKAAENSNLFVASLVAIREAIKVNLGVDTTGVLKSELEARNNAVILLGRQLDMAVAQSNSGISGAAERVKLVRGQLEAAIAASAKVSEQLKNQVNPPAPITPDGKPAGGKKGPAPIVTTPSAAKTAARQNDFADNYINSLATQYANLNGSLTKLDELQRTLIVSGDKFSAAQVKQATTLAGEIDAYRTKQIVLGAQNKTLQEHGALQEAAREQYAQNITALRDEATAWKTTAGYIGKTSEEIEALRFERELNIKITQAESQVLADQNAGLIGQAEALRRLAAIKRFGNETRESYGAVRADAKDQQTNALRGASDALNEYMANAEKAGIAAKNATLSVANGLEDAFTTAFQSGKWEFSSLVDQIIADVVRLKVVRPMINSIFSMGQSDGGNSIASIFSSLFANANGNAFGPSGVIPFAKGGVVTRPTLFPFAKGTGLMGEAGPEAIMPLGRDAQGRLGVRGGGGGGNVQVNIINNAGAQVSQTQRQQGDSTIIDVLVAQVEDRLAGNIATGSGSVYHAMGNTFGMRRAVS